MRLQAIESKVADLGGTLLAVFYATGAQQGLVLVDRGCEHAVWSVTMSVTGQDCLFYAGEYTITPNLDRATEWFYERLNNLIGA